MMLCHAALRVPDMRSDAVESAEPDVAVDNAMQLPEGSPDFFPSKKTSELPTT